MSGIAKSKKHGLCKHPLYKTWKGILARCYDPRHDNYPLYGLKGVCVCKEWMENPKLFMDWCLENGWKKGMQVDKDIVARQQNTIPLIYSPEYCSIVTQSKNNRSKINSRIVEYKGQAKNFAEWCEILNIDYHTTEARISRGWNIDDAFEKPLFKPKILKLNGESKTLPEWCRFYKTRYSSVWNRIYTWGWDINKAISTPTN